jgi:TRAP-type C4-dicarboxylate transport system permease small subunit
MENYIQLLIVGIIALVVVVGVKVVSKIYNDNDRKLSIGKILSYILLYIAVYCLFAGCLIFILLLLCFQ